MTPSQRDAEFAAFVNASADRLHRYGYLLTGSAGEADDLVQETFLKLYLAWDRVEASRSPLGYARTTMARTHVSRWRSLTRRRALEDRVSLDRSLGRAGQHELDAAHVSSSAAERDALWSALEVLGRRQRVVVVLRFYEELSEPEIARVMGTSVGTVKSQLSRALAILRERSSVKDLAGKQV